MEQFSAAGFAYITQSLGALTYRVDSLSRDTDAKELALSYRPLFEMIRGHCEGIGLRTAVMCVDDFTASLDYRMPAAKFANHIADLANCIRREMQACYFFHMPYEQAEFYSQDELF